MDSVSTDTGRIIEALESLRQQVTSLSDRVLVLEQALPDKVREATAATGDHAAPDEISEELVLTISAAIAAYLGVKAPIRQIRVLGSASWAQQGRATIQASHALKIHRS